ncbi:uncharacterized protein LOC121786661 [Salvia splendens]|uniref:uncharacterized protein LOC121786661 n=1 Tax=Salvia splendens TaxID=180675 RepID=UPI001C271AED|nr:uncharacterized protein LOC121786661 [Salvia splendens]
MPTSGLNTESLVVIILDIIRMHQLRIICCLDEKGLLGNGDAAIDARRIRRKFIRLQRIPTQVHRFTRLAKVSDRECVDNLRMDRNCSGRLCILLRERGGLEYGKYVFVEKQVAMFLSVLSHHTTNRIVGFNFWRSGQTVSPYVHAVLKAVIMLHELFLAKPVPVDARIPDGNGSRSKNTCLMWHVRLFGRFRRNMRFVYVLAGWEGSAGDARVLRDAVARPRGVKVPIGQYYLCDNGYANSNGFLTPFKGVQNHLKEWGTGGYDSTKFKGNVQYSTHQGKEHHRTSVCCSKNEMGYPA